MEEIWKDIHGYEGIYQISNLGNVKGLAKTLLYSDGRIYNYKEKILKGTLSRGYPTVHLYNLEGGRETCAIHRLVAQHFIPNPDNKITVNHIDGVKDNNIVTNLEWATYKENNNHAIQTGLHPGTPSGYKRKLSKLSKEAYEDILKNCFKRVDGFSCRDFAEKYGVSEPTIHKIVNKRDKNESRLTGTLQSTSVDVCPKSS